MNPVTGTPMAGGTPAPVAGAAGQVGPVAGQTVGAAGVAGSTVPLAGMGTAGDVGMAGMGAAGNAMAGMAGNAMAGMAGNAMAGVGGMAGGEAGTVAMPGVKRPCVTAGSQVVLIGDSYSNYIVHRSVEDLMTQRAIMNMALPAGQQYTDYAAAGTTLQDKVLGIPAQWNTAKRGTPIHLVIMDGGGNDVLINNPQCLANGSAMNAGCKSVVDASIAVGKELWASMKMTGVKDVIWFWYPHIPGTLNGNGWDINDYALKLFQAEAEKASSDDFRVYMLDTIPIFEGHPEYFVSDGIHATTEGTGKIADAIWKIMKDNCIGQAPSSGCCAM